MFFTHTPLPFVEKTSNQEMAAAVFVSSRRGGLYRDLHALGNSCFEFEECADKF